MNQVGLGIDIVSISRMESILKRTPSFPQRVFSEQECAYCFARPNPAAHFAARFAAKEAVLKALGTGFSRGIGVRDVEVVSGKTAGRVTRPQLKLSGRALEIAQEMGIGDIPLSLSYTSTDAVACAIAMQTDYQSEEDAEGQNKQLQSSTQQLVTRFKEMRGLLDELE